MSMDDQSRYLMMPNAKEQRVSEKSREGGVAGWVEGKRRALQRCEGDKRKQDKGRGNETMTGREERRQEEVSLIYTLKKPQI